MGLHEQFLDIIKLAKQMKKSIVTLQKDCIMGTDETFSSYSELYYNTDQFDLFHDKEDIKFTVPINDLIAFLRTYNINSNYSLNHFGLLFTLDEMNMRPFSHLFHNEDYYHKMIGLRDRSYHYKNIGIMKYNNQSLDETFINLSFMKAKEGSVMYKLDDTHIMSTFSSIHPLTKQYMIKIIIYYMLDKIFLSVFHIEKKNCHIDEYIRYRML